MHPSPTFPLAAVVLAFLAGCAAAPPSRFYLLSPVSAEMAAPAANRAAAIGVGPIALPNYLDRPQIAMRRGANELYYSEINRWAEALRDNVADVLAQNLSVLVPTDRVFVFPWSRTTMIDYQVVVEIARFEADAGGNVVLSANWRLLREGVREALAMKNTTLSEPAGGSGYTEIVAAQSRALAALSREIAAAIRATQNR